ncbi:Citron Rho-Interacting Kinase [Manis pentadactyla]|nr:Citron Rho-Interacting Kinase [Manis pentadactyla]
MSGGGGGRAKTVVPTLLTLLSSLRRSVGVGDPQRRRRAGRAESVRRPLGPQPRQPRAPPAAASTARRWASGGGARKVTAVAFLSARCLRDLMYFVRRGHSTRRRPPSPRPGCALDAEISASAAQVPGGPGGTAALRGERGGPQPARPGNARLRGIPGGSWVPETASPLCTLQKN